MKNIIRSIEIAAFLITVFSFFSCKKFLKEEVYTQYDPITFLQNEQGINSVLNAAYSNMEVTSNLREMIWTLNEFPGDIMWEFGGSFVNSATLYMSFNWDPQQSFLQTAWQNFYVSIRNANSLLDNIDNVKSISADKINEFKAEARFIRAEDYYQLWQLFGPVPLITTAESLDLQPSRVTQQDFDDFITTEFKAAADGLPLSQDLYGKATKGAALALLGEYYLNNHQWQLAADLNKEVIDLNLYSLYAGDIKNQFAVENEENNSVIFTSPALTTLHGNLYMAHAFPPNFPIQSNWINYGAQFCIYNNWVKTYSPSDKRLEWFLFNYTDVNGKYHNLLDPSDAGQAVRCFKYVPDPNGISENHGNDVPVMRYAEILLNRSEALNELNGPNQESVDLLNQIRQRAGVPTYGLSDFSSKDFFRNSLLEERGWEFVAEGKRRMDLIRHGKLISKAQERGAVDAKDFMTVYPIPANEISANPNLKQNQGY